MMASLKEDVFEDEEDVVLETMNMDQIRLAQFNSISNSSNNHGYDFLIRNIIDVKSVISDKSSPRHPWEVFAGYTYLHFAAMNSDLASVNELIRRDASLVKQGSKDGKTPLHIVSGRFEKSKKESFGGEEFHYTADFLGRLKEDKFVNALLSATVEASVTSNPVSTDGTSHLHIASMYNHVGAVEMLLNAGESVNHVTSDNHKLPGYTALHFAIRHSANDVAKLLLSCGADIHLKNNGGQSVLHLLIERLMGIANFLATGKRTYHPFYKQERDILESIVEIILKGNPIITDDIGLTSLHLACALNSTKNVKNLLKQNVDLNSAIKTDSKFWPGWTSLHFAACFSIKTFKLLLSYGADFQVKNVKGETPFDLCMQRYTPDVVYEILSTHEELRNIVFTDGSTKLTEVLLFMCNDDIFIEWLISLRNIDINIPRNSPIWPGCNFLHLAILNERIELDDPKMVFEVRLGVSSYRLSRSTRTETGLMGYWEQIITCLLANNYNFNQQNADGHTPFYLAYELGKKISMEKILKNAKINEEDSNGLSYFHIACATNNTEVIQSMVDSVDVNEPVTRDLNIKIAGTESIFIREKSTPLHIAVITGNTAVTKYLVENDADIHAKDQHGLEPIHLALINGNLGSARLLLEKMIELKEFVTQDNLHCLHIAAICNNGVIIKNCLDKGCYPDVPFQPTNLEMRSKFADDLGKTPLHIALLRKNESAVEALIKGDADFFGTPGKISNPLLNLAVKHGYHVKDYLFPKLKQKKRYVIKPIDDSGVTMLHLACHNHDVKWAKTLLKRKANPNAQVACANDFRIFWRGVTPLHVLVNTMCHWIEDEDVVIEMLKLLMEYKADVLIKNSEDKTPLHVLYYGAHERFTYSCGKKYSENMMSTIDVLLNGQKTFDVNPTDPHGLSHFHLACNRGNLEIVKKFLENGVDVNHTLDAFTRVKHHAGFTPLHFAIEKNHLDVAIFLIENGANVKTEDVQGDTPLHLAVKQGFLDVKLIQFILRYGGDINAKNVKGTTTIEYLLMTEGYSSQQLHALLNHGAVVDLMSPKPSEFGIIGLAMLNAEPNDRPLIFRRIIDSCDIENLIDNNCNIIDSLVNVKQKGKPGKLTADFYLEVIDQLVDAGCDPDQQDQDGKTALHRAARLYNHEAVKALLFVGANLNILDNNGESPLTKEILNDKSSDRRNYTLDFVACQIYKMRNKNLHVSESTKNAFFEALKLNFITSYSYMNYSTVKKLCLRELNRLRNTYINKLHLEQFLSETDAVMQYSRMSVAEREAIDAFFMCRDNIREAYPEWAGFLLMQYRKAVARTKMLKPAMEVIFLAGIRLPALCLNEIVQYLNNDELKILVERF